MMQEQLQTAINQVTSLNRTLARFGLVVTLSKAKAETTAPAKTRKAGAKKAAPKKQAAKKTASKKTTAKKAAKPAKSRAAKKTQTADADLTF